MPATADRAVGPYVVATFTCARCGAEAARAAFVPKGAPDPFTPAPNPNNREASYVVWRQGRGGVTIGAPRGDRALELVAALDRADPAALYRLDPEYAPFWCPTCAAVYCRDHYRTWDVFADDYPGWYEETRGVCVEGHLRQIYD